VGGAGDAGNEPVALGLVAVGEGGGGGQGGGVTNLCDRDEAVRQRM
jgi:hypothetical protein